MSQGPLVLYEKDYNEIKTVIDKLRYLEDAVEIDVDAISDGSIVVVAGIMEHIEEAGVTPGIRLARFPHFPSPRISSRRSPGRPRRSLWT